MASPARRPGQARLPSTARAARAGPGNSAKSRKGTVMRNDDREARVLGVVAVAAFAGIAMVAYSAVVATQPQQARPVAATVLPVPAGDTQAASAFDMSASASAPADGQVFEYY